MSCQFLLPPSLALSRDCQDCVDVYGNPVKASFRSVRILRIFRSDEISQRKAGGGTASRPLSRTTKSRITKSIYVRPEIAALIDSRAKELGISPVSMSSALYLVQFVRERPGLRKFTLQM